ncbi:hypothetical protein DFH09DRAFT_1327126 [Mycena vulgaris]|nr:hypothetical protein DFH09DRAFT_1327126 [Mycena vulgaris]
MTSNDLRCSTLLIQSHLLAALPPATPSPFAHRHSVSSPPCDFPCSPIRCHLLTRPPPPLDGPIESKWQENLALLAPAPARQSIHSRTRPDYIPGHSDTPSTPQNIPDGHRRRWSELWGIVCGDFDTQREFPRYLSKCSR